MRTGVTRARFEKLAAAVGLSVREYHLNIYYTSLGRSYPETFLEVMDGDKPKVCYNLETIRHWVTEDYLKQTFLEIRSNNASRRARSTTGYTGYQIRDSR